MDRRYTLEPPPSPLADVEPLEPLSGLKARLNGREHVVISDQELCDDLLGAVPALHAAIASHGEFPQRWRRVRSPKDGVADVFELAAPRAGVVHALAAVAELKCHLNEVLNVLVAHDSGELEATRRALAGRSFEAGEVLFHEACGLDQPHDDGSGGGSGEHHEAVDAGGAQVLLGVETTTLRPNLRLKLLPRRRDQRRTQRLCFATLTHKYPGAPRAVHMMKTLPKPVHDQVVPRCLRGALTPAVDHISIGFDVASTQRPGGSNRQTTRVFCYAYASAVPSSSSTSQSTSQSVPSLTDYGQYQRRRINTAPDLASHGLGRRPVAASPEVKHVLNVLTQQLQAFERVVQRRRLGFQSFTYFPTSASDVGQQRRSGLVPSCVICLKPFNALRRREFFCQLCGHLVCKDCSQLYEVEARVGEIRKNRACVQCVARVDSCVFDDEDLVSALGPPVVMAEEEPGGWFHDLDDADDYDDDYDEVESATSSAPATVESLSSQLHSQDPVQRSVALAQLGLLVAKSGGGNGAAHQAKPPLRDRVQKQVDRHVSRALRGKQREYPLSNLVVADLVHDYAYSFDASKTTYKDHPLPPTPTPDKEARRLHYIQASGVLAPEYDHAALDLLAQVAAKRLGCPIGFVSLVTEAAFHSVGTFPPRNFGLVAPRAESMCAHTVYVDKPLVVKNAQRDMRFAQMPVVRDHGIKFYAGFPIRAPDGAIVGSLCATDRTPHHHISSKDYATMDVLCKLAAQLVAPAARTEKVTRQPRLLMSQDSTGSGSGTRSSRRRRASSSTTGNWTRTEQWPSAPPQSQPRSQRQRAPRSQQPQPQRPHQHRHHESRQPQPRLQPQPPAAHRSHKTMTISTHRQRPQDASLVH